MGLWDVDVWTIRREQRATAKTVATRVADCNDAACIPSIVTSVRVRLELPLKVLKPLIIRSSFSFIDSRERP